MTDNEIIASALEVGYKASRKNEVVNIEKISKDLGEEVKRVEDLANFMEKKGWMEWYTQYPLQIQITREGINEYEKRHEGSE